MRELITMGLALGLLVTLLRLKIRIGRAMCASSLALAIMLKVTPGQMAGQLTAEFTDPAIAFTQTTTYLFISLTALLLLVNVIGAVMQETGISVRLIPALYGLLRSRRVALAVMPLIMGMLPTPGGIMLSAPMVRDMGDSIGVSRTRQAAINFFFRHQWESVWPLFPAVPLVQSIFAVSAFAVLSHNIVIPIFGITGGAIFLLLIGIPPRKNTNISHSRFGYNLRDFAHAFWPIAVTAGLYAVFNIPPAVGIFIAIIVLLIMHKVPLKSWLKMFKAANEPDMVLLVFAALFFKFNLQAAGAIPNVVDFLQSMNLPPACIIFFLPFLVGFLTGVTMPTVAVTFPFLTDFIGTGEAADMALATLAFAGVMTGLFLTPVHLCLPLSAGYFKAPITKIIATVLPPTLFVAAAGAIMALIAN
jgi:hypothetical protein